LIFPENEEEQGPSRSKFSRRVLQSNDYRYKEMEDTQDDKVDIKALIADSSSMVFLLLSLINQIPTFNPKALG
jgi:hypothetical protein